MLPRRSRTLVAAVSTLLAVGAATRADASRRGVTAFDEMSVSPDGTMAATAERDALQGHDGPAFLLLHPLDGGAPVRVTLPCSGPGCVPGASAWSSDGRRLVFVLGMPGTEEQSLWETDRSGRAPHQLLRFAGLLDKPRFGPGGQLAVLAVAHPHKLVGATKPGVAMTGEIVDAPDEQRIALVQDGALRFVTPAGLFVYEYDWRPSGHGFVATAAPGDGDANWWVAKLHALGTDGSDHVLYAPGVSEQLADPVVSPDGRHVAFIDGLMSDFGSTGGDAYSLALEEPNAKPVDLTPGLDASVTDLAPDCAGGLAATLLHDDHYELVALRDPSAHPAVLWHGGADSVSQGGWNAGLACHGRRIATIRQDFTHAPVLSAGMVGSPLTDLTHADAPPQPAVTVRSLHWTSDGHRVQSWLLEPAGGAPGSRPMVVYVHGGPSAANTPHVLANGLVAPLLAAGWDVLEPNPRGSFGQGEAFTRGDIRDLGHGPLQDILRGVDAAEKAADRAHPVDDKRLGLFGYSYGGYMAMWAPTETNRFRASVSGGGVSDWLSIEGEEGISTSDVPFFGVSVFDDAKPYLDASPILRMKQVHTPVFAFVGERDIECPMPQTQEYIHALRTLGVPNEFVVYPGQGHGLSNKADMQDAKARTVAWFKRWFAQG